MRAAADASADDAPRYSDAAGVENHPQVTDFIPRRYRTIAILVLIGVGTTTVLAALDYFAGAIAQASGARAVNAIVMTTPGSLASWLSAVLLLLASGTCLLTYSIRRHRIDDFRGRYRVWLGASIVCLTMSANSVTGLHQTLADILSHATGWAALRDGAAWWLMVPGLPVAWVLFRALFDVRECRFAAALALVAVTSYAISAATFLGLVPVAESQARVLVVGTTLLAGHWFVLAAAVSYARFVVLDAQGLITVRRPQPAKKVQKVQKSVAKTDLPTVATMAKSTPSVLSAAGYSRATLQTAKTPADSSRWVDGSRPERDRYDRDKDDDDSSGGQKLSKTDRKKLRKLKTEGRAA
jgi:hypothetical protein